MFFDFHDWYLFFWKSTLLTPLDSGFTLSRGRQRIILIFLCFNFSFRIPPPSPMATLTSARPAQPGVEIDSLRQKVRETKSPSTARYYLAMLNRLEEFNGESFLSLDSVNPDFISGFADHLIREGVTPSSIKLFQMSFRAVMKEAFGMERRQQFKEVFSGLGSKNESPAQSLSPDDLHNLLDTDLSGKPLLEKTRDLLLFSLFGAGTDLFSIGTEDSSLLPHQQKIAEAFPGKYGIGFREYISSINRESYTENLAVLALATGISGLLTPESSARLWTDIARCCGLATDLMASSLAIRTAFSQIVNIRNHHTPEEIYQAKLKVANRISDERHHWYVMRCFTATPDEISSRIKSEDSPLAKERIDTFVPPSFSSEKNKGKSSARNTGRLSFLETLLFFHCSRENAGKIRRHLGNEIYLYTLSGTAVPAPISDREMKTFMILCDIGRDSLSCYFPDRDRQLPEVTEGATAKIIAGSASGNIGIIGRISPDRYEVELKFQSLGGARVTATVPLEFIQLTPD